MLDVSKRIPLQKNVSFFRFVEHGEYKGHLYGTRRDSIFYIVDSGRVPILTPSAKVGKSFPYHRKCHR